MKRTLKRILGIMLSIMMCMELLPVTALAELSVEGAEGGGVTDPLGIWISGTTAMTGGTTQPTISVEWTISGSPDATNDAVMVCAWKGTSGERPDAYWRVSNQSNSAGTGSFNGKMNSVSDPETLSGDCMVCVYIYDKSDITTNKASATPVQVTAVTGVTITGTPTLSGGEEPSLSVSWKYGATLPDGCKAKAFAWVGDDFDHAWYSRDIDTSGTTDSFTGTLSGDSYSAALEGTCNVMVRLYPPDNATWLDSEVAQVTISGGSSSGGGGEGGEGHDLPEPGTTVPTIERVEYYDKNPDPNAVGEQANYPAVWYLYSEGSNKLEVFALLPAESEDAAKSASAFGYPGFESGGQWYSVAGIWTVSTSDLLDKGDGHRALYTPLYCDSKPEEGTTLYLALWDYEYKGLSNLVPVTVPAEGGKAEGTGVAVLTITTSSFPEATVGKAYGPVTLAGKAANDGALSWSITDGSLPAGLTLENGVISGTPTTPGTSSFELTLSEAGGGTVKKTFTIKVSNAAPKIAVQTLPAAVRNLPYSIPLKGTASGGGALSWSLKEGSSLPTGLTLSTAGEISGTTTAQAGSYSFTVVLSEAEIADKAEKTLSLAVREPYRYDISYNLNGGTTLSGNLLPKATVTESSNEKWNVISLPEAPVRLGYDFGGWKLGGRIYDAGAQFTVTSASTFVAQWNDPAPVTVTYTGKVVGDYDLVGRTTGNGNSVYLGGGRAFTPAAPSGLVINWNLLRNYSFASVGLWGYVDGRYTQLAEYSGFTGGTLPADTTSIALTALSGMTDLKFVTDINVTAGDKTLVRNTDYSLGSIEYNGYSLGLPFMTTHDSGFTVRINGKSSSVYYNLYKWKWYDNVTFSNTTANVKLEEMPAGVTVEGKVYFGEGTDTPLSGVRVQFNQYLYGQSVNYTATTDETGKYSVTGLQPPASDGQAGAIWYQVLSGGTQMSGGSSKLSLGTDGGSTKTHDIHVTTAPVSLYVTEDMSGLDSSLTSSQRYAVQYAGTIDCVAEFKENGISRGSFYQTINGSSRHFLQAPGADSVIDYTITGSAIQKVTGSITLTGGAYSNTCKDPIVIKPRAGAVVHLTSPTYSNFAMMWFKNGTRVGTSDSFTISSGSGKDYYFPAPDGAGTYTLVLVPFTSVGALSSDVKLSELGDNNVKSWEVTLAEDEVAGLESFTLTKAASEEAAYVTLPNSTLTADKESFSTTNDLVRFTGSIGLDSGLTNGRLGAMKINVRNDVDNVSYSNTAPVQYVVIDGKLYGTGNDGFNMSSTGYYYKYDLSVKLPCSYTIYCKPGDADWDMQLSVYANVSSSGGTAYDQLVGSATVKKPGASITTLSSYVCKDTVAVKGTGIPTTDMNSPSTVEIFDGNTLIGTAQVDRKGLWEAKVTLAGVDDTYASAHRLTSRTASGVVSDDLYVFHDPQGVQQTDFRMSWGSNPKGINMGESYVYAGGMSGVNFSATFENPDRLEGTVYGDTAADSSKVAFQYYLTNGTVGLIHAAESTKNADGSTTFSGRIPETIYSSVVAADVLCSPVMSSRAVKTKEGIKTYAISDTDLAGASTFLDKSKASARAAFASEKDPSFTAAFDHKGATPGVKITDTNADASRRDSIPTSDALSEYAADKAADGVELQTFAVEYNSENGMLKWLNESAKDWKSIKKDSGDTGSYVRTMTFNDKADFEAQTALLAKYADYKSALENADSTVGGQQFYFTDTVGQNDGSALDEGSYLADIVTFSDDTRGLYVINAALILDEGFSGYAKPLPNDEASTEGSVNGSWWNGRDDSNNNVSTTQAAIQKAAQNRLDKPWYQRALESVGFKTSPVENMVNRYNDYNDADMASRFAKASMEYDMSQIVGSNEWKEITGRQDYYMETNKGFGTFYSEGMGNGVPTIKNRIDQMKEDLKTMQEDDGAASLAEQAKAELGWLSDIAEVTNDLYKNAGSDTVKGIIDFSTGVGEIVCDKISMDKQLARLEVYNRFMENWNYVQNWYQHNYGFGSFGKKGSGGGSGGKGGNDDTERSSSRRAREMAEESKTKKPPITNKVSNDPAGTVFEGVIENPVKDADVTLYYAAKVTGTGENRIIEKVDKDHGADATAILKADDMDDLIPDDPVQTTGEDGKYSWGVPEGLWYVTARQGGLSGSSGADKAATVSSSLTLNEAAVEKLLPVLPVQLDVNIPLVDVSAPAVSDVAYIAGEGVYVTFDKYMKEGIGDASCLGADNYTISVNGVDKAFTAAPALQGHYPDNLEGGGEDAAFTKTVLLGCEELSAGDTVVLNVKGSIESYAGAAIGETNTYTGDVTVKEKLDAPLITVSSTDEAVKAGAVSADRSDALIISLSENAVGAARIVYSIDDEDERAYTSPLAVGSGFVLKARATAVGYTDSDTVTVTVTVNDDAPASVDGASAEEAAGTVAAKEGLVYNGNAQELVSAPKLALPEGYAMMYALGTDAFATPEQGWSATIPTGTDAGTYYVWYYAKGEGVGADTAPGCVEATIKPAGAPTLKEGQRPTSRDAADLKHTGKAITLLNAPSAALPEGYTMMYALGADPSTAPKEGWSKDIPAATDAGTYYVWYYAKGDGNHTDTEPACITVTITAGEKDDDKDDDKKDEDKKDEDKKDEDKKDDDKKDGDTAEVKVPITDGAAFAAVEDNLAAEISGGKITAMKLNFEKVKGSGVAMDSLKMTVLKGTKLTTVQKAASLTSVTSSSRKIKVKVNKKTMQVTTTVKESGSVTYAMEDGNTYVVTYTVQTPKGVKQKLPVGDKEVRYSVKDLFGTTIDAGTLSATDKAGLSKALGNVLVITPTAATKVKVQYQYLNKKFKTTITVK